MTPLSSPGSVLFASLPNWKFPRSEFFLSYSLQAATLAFFFWVPVLTPQVLESKRDYHAIELVPTPVPENHEPQRQLRNALLEPRMAPVATNEALRLPAPRPQAKPRIEDAPAPEVKILARKLDAVPSPRVDAVPKQLVRTNLFSTGNSAPQTTERAAQQVQTGGFGDPNGIPARTEQTRAVNIAQAGGFDLPTGPGYGNGSGGTRGARGVVASTGFGNGVATVAVRSTTPAGVVRHTEFGNADVPAPTTAQSHAAGPAVALVPAEILSKPVPIYTDEARSKRIEGEVLLEVVFESTGKLHVVKIVRGLGHGLDDAAVHAAEQIRFKPALKDGQPADSTAVVHIIFQLA